MDTLKVKVTNFGNKFGIRLINTHDNSIIAESSVSNKLSVGDKIKEMLRTQNKYGHSSEMAEASRTRFYCKKKY